MKYYNTRARPGCQAHREDPVLVQGEGEHLVWINHAVDNVAFKARLTPPPAAEKNGQNPFHSAVSRRIRVESLSDRLALLSFHRPQPYSVAIAAGPSTAHNGFSSSFPSVSSLFHPLQSHRPIYPIVCEVLSCFVLGVPLPCLGSS